MRLVDDDQVVVREHLVALQRVDGEQRVVGDDDVGAACLRAGAFGEAVRTDGALRGAETFLGGHRNLAPGLVGDAGDELVAVAGLGV